MGTSSICLCLLFLCGALGLGSSLSLACLPVLISADPPGLTTSPTRGRLRCYTCSFSKPCYPVLTECQDDEVCGISIGTSEQSEIIERKGCLPRAQCPLQGHATYWSRSYALRHHCCEQNLCNTATVLQRLPSPLLITLLLLVASFMWGAHLLH
ncbi:lymphocyte antigen 6G6e-like isoform X1 [Panthera pardus]|uniref:Lymphocyte antigen 6G6e-like isoform X1 n=1 Tax=Panthera pardus TaxID=9691 RepID=A0A9V1F325_PANPR|nr:lymphocyte antigen 6G6e-like isoform X1 [Panthera pardus]